MEGVLDRRGPTCELGSSLETNPQQTRLFEAVAKAGELQPLLDEVRPCIPELRAIPLRADKQARDFNFVEEVTAPFPPAGLGSTTTLDRLIAAVYALAHEPEGRLPTVTRGIRAYIGEVRGKVQRFVATVPERPIDPNLKMEWKMIHSTVKDLKTCMGDMEMMARQLEQYQAFFKNLVYQ